MSLSFAYYLMSLSEPIKTLFGLYIGFFAIGWLAYFLICSTSNNMYIFPKSKEAQNYKVYRFLTRMGMILFVISILFVTFIPNKETMITMYSINQVEKYVKNNPEAIYNPQEILGYVDTIMKGIPDQIKQLLNVATEAVKK